METEPAQSALPAPDIDFRRLAESAADVLVQIDADGQIQWGSSGTASLLGIDADALIGRLCLSLVHPDDRAGFAGATQTALAQGRSRADARLGSSATAWAWHSIVIHRMTGETGTLLVVSGRLVERGTGADATSHLVGRLPAGSNLSASPALTRTPGDAPTVLLVDDEPLVRAVAARMLRALGYPVVMAADAGAVLALNEEELACVDVLMADIVMPGLGGLQLAAMLDERRPGLPTLFISGYVPAAGVEAEFLRPATSFLTKPFSKDELATALGALLGDRAAPAPAAQLG